MVLGSPSLRLSTVADERSISLLGRRVDEYFVEILHSFVERRRNVGRILLRETIRWELDFGKGPDSGPLVIGRDLLGPVLLRVLGHLNTLGSFLEFAWKSDVPEVFRNLNGFQKKVSLSGYLRMEHWYLELSALLNNEGVAEQLIGIGSFAWVDLHHELYDVKKILRVAHWNSAHLSKLYFGVKFLQTDTHEGNFLAAELINNYSKGVDVALAAILVVFPDFRSQVVGGADLSLHESVLCDFGNAEVSQLESGVVTG